MNQNEPKKKITTCWHGNTRKKNSLRLVPLSSSGLWFLCFVLFCSLQHQLRYRNFLKRGLVDTDHCHRSCTWSELGMISLLCVCDVIIFLLPRWVPSFPQVCWLGFSCRGPFLFAFSIQPDAKCQAGSVNRPVPFSIPVSYHEPVSIHSSASTSWQRTAQCEKKRWVQFVFWAEVSFTY